MTDADRTSDTSGSPSGSAPLIGDRDGEVSRRLTVRCRLAASTLGVLGASLVVVPVFRSWSMVSAGLTCVAVVVLSGAGLLAIRARTWSAVGRSVVPADGGADAIVGPPRPLSPGLPGAPVKRKFGASVVPVHQDQGRQPGAGALIVHARMDLLALANRDAVKLWHVGSGVLAPPGEPRPGPARASVGGRFVLIRERDGAVFLATTRLTDTW